MNIRKDHKPIITIHDNFFIADHKINPWTSYQCFPNLDILDKSRYDEFAIIEIRFIGTHGNNKVYNERIKPFNTFLHKFLLAQQNDIYLFTVSDKELKNKIRTYKGIFPKCIPKEFVYSKEFDLEDNSSIIEGVVRLNSTTFNLVRPILFFREKSFLLLSSDNQLSSTVLDDIYLKILNQNKLVINYLALCLFYCRNGNLIIREMGDGGDQEFSWQIFMEKKGLEYQLALIQNILEDK